MGDMSTDVRVSEKRRFIDDVDVSVRTLSICYSVAASDLSAKLIRKRTKEKADCVWDRAQRPKKKMVAFSFSI